MPRHHRTGKWVLPNEGWKMLPMRCRMVGRMHTRFQRWALRILAIQQRWSVAVFVALVADHPPSSHPSDQSALWWAHWPFLSLLPRARQHQLRVKALYTYLLSPMDHGLKLEMFFMLRNHRRYPCLELPTMMAHQIQMQQSCCQEYLNACV